MESITKIAVLLTCHNRAAKTETCLNSFKDALEHYCKESDNKINYEIFLTDDGCTDGTIDAVKAIFPDENVLHVLTGDGNLYWAGGMRFCWNEALKRHDEWDFYLLLNDDVEILPNVFDDLIEAHRYAIEQYGKEGLYSGITCDPENREKMTYGGNVWTNRFLAQSVRLNPSGTPQLCDVTNANILLVSKTVVDKIGIFYKGFVHGSADQDYSWMARRKGIPVLLTSHFCGLCPMDHKNKNEMREKLEKMSFNERKEYFKHPLHSSREEIISEWRMNPFRVPLTVAGRLLILFFPKIYYWVNDLFRK